MCRVSAYVRAVLFSFLILFYLDVVFFFPALFRFSLFVLGPSSAILIPHAMHPHTNTLFDCFCVTVPRSHISFFVCQLFHFVFSIYISMI